MDASRELLTDGSGSIKFAVIAAPYLCGGDERLSDLHLFYDQLVFAQVMNVLIVGPVFDPHAVVSRGQQLRYLADNYPHGPGIVTHALQYNQARIERSMRAAGRSDWSDFSDPVVMLRRPGSGAYVPLLLGYDPGGILGLQIANYPALGHHANTINLVAAFGGDPQYETVWNDGQLLVSVGVFSGSDQLDSPVGGTVFDLKINNPYGSLEREGYPTDFWDFNGL